MGRDLLVGVDAGTSVMKAVAFTLAGQPVAFASRPNSYETPGPGQVEQDMARTWADCAATLRDLGGKVPDFADRVAGLAVTAQGDGTWLIDRDGEPVGGGLLWLDSRAADLVAAHIAGDRYDRHYESTGSGLNACMASAQIAWMKRHQPERLARAATALHCKDWLYFKLTGERVTDPAEGNFTFGNFRTRRYEPAILDGLGIGECARLLPPILEGTEVSHPLATTAAAALGLPAGLPVVLGYLDVICTALGSGINDGSDGVGISIFGSTGMHMRYAVSAGEVRLNPARTGYTMAFPVPGACVTMQSNMAATLNIDWFLDLAREAARIAGVEIGRPALLANMDERVLAAPAGAAIFHPYIFEAGERGPFLDPNARAQFSGLSSKTGFATMMRAIYEGLAFAARDCYLAMGGIPNEVRLGGGAARSKALAAILASVLGAQVRTVEREEGGAAGAAMMAAVCLGHYATMADCVDAWVKPLLGRPTRPDARLGRLYTRLHPVYVSIRQGMTPRWQEMARIRQEFAT